jgi:hypothetical protein
MVDAKIITMQARMQTAQRAWASGVLGSVRTSDAFGGRLPMPLDGPVVLLTPRHNASW